MNPDARYHASTVTIARGKLASAGSRVLAMHILALIGAIYLARRVVKLARALLADRSGNSGRRRHWLDDEGAE